jgi:hypothetical protein
MCDKKAIESKLREYKPLLERQYCVKKIDGMPVIPIKKHAV